MGKEHLDFAELLLSCKRYEKAARLLVKLEEDADMTMRPRVYFLLASVHYSLRNYSKARSYYNNLLAIQKDSDVLSNLAAVCLAQGDFLTAIEFAREAIDLSKGSCVSAFMNLHSAQRSYGRLEEAIAYTTTFLGIPRAPIKDNDSSNLYSVRSSSSNSLAICCVKWGTKYGPHYVNRLFYAIKRNWKSKTLQFPEFYCFTDDPKGLDQSISRIPLKKKRYEFFWGKAEIFEARELLGKLVCFLDLDTVVVGDVASLFAMSRPGRLLTLSAKGLNNEMGGLSDGVVNTSVMVWHHSKSWLQVALLATTRVQSYVHRFDHWMEICGEGVIDYVIEGVAIDYQGLSDQLTGNLGDGVSPEVALLIFPGGLKPHEAVDSCRIVATNWVD